MKLTKTLITTALLGASVFSFQSTVYAMEEEQFDKIVHLFEQKDFNSALAIIRPLAEQGDGVAQAMLAALYKNGDGVKENKTEAIKWYQKAAENNNSRAQAIVGLAYMGGIGVKQNFATAKKWFGKACDNKEQKGCEMYKQLNQGTK
ncbi:TPA: tetratricopeptide repeat protein [Haemophilus influenzae]